MTDQEAWESRNAVTFLPNVQQLFQVHQDSAHNMRVSHMKAGLSCGRVVLVDVVIEDLVQILQASAFGMLERFRKPRFAFMQGQECTPALLLEEASQSLVAM